MPTSAQATRRPRAGFREALDAACSKGAGWCECGEGRRPRLVEEGRRISSHLHHGADLAAEAVRVTHVAPRVCLLNHQPAALVTEIGRGAWVGVGGEGSGLVFGKAGARAG